LVDDGIWRQQQPNRLYPWATCYPATFAIRMKVKTYQRRTKIYVMVLPIFAARRSYASAVLGVVIILSVCPSVRLSHACFVTNPKNLSAMFLYYMKGQSF